MKLRNRKINEPLSQTILFESIEERTKTIEQQEQKCITNRLQYKYKINKRIHEDGKTIINKKISLSRRYHENETVNKYSVNI